MDTETVNPTTLSFSAGLPILGAEIFGGKFYGITTLKDGTHAAVILLPNKAQERLTWMNAVSWAQEAGGVLPTRPVAALLYANAKDQFEETWCWTGDTLDKDTGDESDASYAWYCNFSYGDQDNGHKSAAGGARAVRLIPLVL